VGGTVADSGGVTFVPALAGLAAPWWRGDLRGSLTGLGLDTTAGHVVRALCEGIAAQVAELAEAAAGDLGAPLTTLRVDGGLTRSALLMQTQADLLQRPVEVSALADATALGAATLARLGADPGLSVADALPDGRPATVYEPRIPADQAAERRAGFRAAVAALLGA
ncbi:FGGY-family carbohydrate kinase, partial [Streptomyces sp. NPDC001356]